MGIGRNDRVAIVLPNGPEMAAAFIAIACGATTAPLNPAYRAEEFDFYLSDLNAKALVILEGMESPALAVAEARGIPVVRAGARTTRPATSRCTARRAPARRRRAALREEDDIALVLHTSGTTSRPKIVPLDPHQCHGLGLSHRQHAGAARGRCLPQHHAAVPHPRPDRRHAVQHRGGRIGGLHARASTP